MITIIPISEIEQGSDSWHKLRSQYVTATDCYDLLQGVPISEILNKKTSNSFHGNYYTQRGHDLEPDARYIYSGLYTPVTEAGFVLNDKYPQAGFSPDGLVGEDGLIEIKCFNEKRHFAVHDNLDPHIFAQIQFQLFISERNWCDLVNYNPDIPDPHQAFLVKRILPDKTIHSKLNTVLRKKESCQQA